MKTLTKEKSSAFTDTENISGALAIVKCLLEEQVEYIFGYPGGAIMPVYDAMYDYQEELKHILNRHEQGAVHAAQGYARATGRVGVCIATSGPGATNLITGIADALIDSTPLVCITGQVPKRLIGSDAFQETDVIGISLPVTKWNYQITKASEIPEIFAKAFYIAASGRPGPVLIDITKNAQIEMLDYYYKKCDHVRSYVPVPKANPTEIERAAELINKAKRPFLLFGHGVTISGAEKELKEVIEKTGVPAAWTIMGLSALETEHPQNVGMLGMHGNYGPNILTNECDVMIAVGMRFDDRVTGDLNTYAKQAKVIHLEIDPAEVDKNVKTEVALVGDCKVTMQALLPLLKKNNHKPWLQRFHDCMKMEQEMIIEKELHPSKEGMTMGEVIRRINDRTDGRAIIVTDVGQHQMVACRYARFQQHRGNITSGGLGTMGFCLPAAFGAKLGAPNRDVVAIIGDGGFQMTLQELGTIWQTQTNVKIVILNNEFLGMVRQWQQLFFDKRYSATELVNPNFVAISKGFGIDAERVDKRENLDDALNRMFGCEQSYLLEIMVEKEDCVFPMIPAGASVSQIRLS